MAAPTSAAPAEPPAPWNCHCPEGTKQPPPAVESKPETPPPPPIAKEPSKEIPPPPPTDLDFSNIVKEARDAFNTGKSRDLQFREDQLRRLSALYEENTTAMLEAIEKDLGRNKFESQMIEVEAMKHEVKNAIKKVKKWAKAKTPKKPKAHCFDQLKVQREPYGVVLIIAAWNYPMALSFRPICGAIAGGNCFVVKPAESEASGRFIEDKLKEYLDNDCFKVVLGGEKEATALLRERFDYIFYTGSPTVAQMVREASNKHLTPTTLELGGKCPVYVDDTADRRAAIARILWGKCINCGQTCIAPDYLMCTKELETEMVEYAKDILKEWYGEKVDESHDYARMRSEKEYSRVSAYLSNGTVAVGGEHDEAKRFIAPTILIDIRPEDPIMEQEIFGPILPVLTMKDEQEAIDFINKGDRPLAMYIFSINKETIQKFLDKVQCGGVCINDTAVHAGVLSLPFGGVGKSGMGQYHGKWSFDTFTHPRGLLKAKYKEKKAMKRYPPYDEKKTKAITKMLHS